MTTDREQTNDVDLFGPLGMDLDGSCPSCGTPDIPHRGAYCEECD